MSKVKVKKNRQCTIQKPAWVKNVNLVTNYNGNNTVLTDNGIYLFK